MNLARTRVTVDGSAFLARSVQAWLIVPSDDTVQIAKLALTTSGDRWGTPAQLGNGALTHPGERAGRSRVPAYSLLWFGIVNLIAIGAFAAGLPLLAMGVMTSAAVAGLTLGALDGERRYRPVEIDPADIVSIDARDAYRAIVRGVDELTHTTPPRNPIVARCAAICELCGKIALQINPLQRYLDDHDSTALRAERERLATRAAACRDPRAAQSLTQAAEARSRQLAIYDELAAMRERLLARLELVRASIEAYAAMAMRIRATEDDGADNHGAVVDQLADVAAELDVVESALRELAA